MGRLSSYQGLRGKVYAVPGNCDPPVTLNYIERSCTSLHLRKVRIGERDFVGLWRLQSHYLQHAERGPRGGDLSTARSGDGARGGPGGALPSIWV